MTGGKPMPHSYERRDVEYKRWVRMLKGILLARFGISVEDSFDEHLLRKHFNGGDSPADIAQDLGNKRELTELSSNPITY